MYFSLEHGISFTDNNNEILRLNYVASTINFSLEWF